MWAQIMLKFWLILYSNNLSVWDGCFSEFWDENRLVSRLEFVNMFKLCLCLIYDYRYVLISRPLSSPKVFIHFGDHMLISTVVFLLLSYFFRYNYLSVWIWRLRMKGFLIPWHAISMWTFEIKKFRCPLQTCWSP